MSERCTDDRIFNSSSEYFRNFSSISLGSFFGLARSIVVLKIRVGGSIERMKEETTSSKEDSLDSIISVLSIDPRNYRLEERCDKPMELDGWPFTVSACSYLPLATRPRADESRRLNIALELAKHNPVYEDIASKFFEHFLFISDAMTFQDGSKNEVSLWNDEEGFYFDAIVYGPDDVKQLPVRSLVGLIPLFATLTLEPSTIKKFPGFKKRMEWFISNRSVISKRNIANMSRSSSASPSS